MRRHMRRTAAAGFLGSVIIGIMPPGCGTGMGQVTIRQTASDEHPAVPAITAARLGECVTKHGGQLEPQVHRLHPTVQVDREGVTWGVTAGDVPASADDFAACTRMALNDMAIPEWIMRLRPMEATNEATGAQRLYMGSPAVVVVVVVGLSELVLEAGAYTFLFAVTVKVVEKAAEDVAELAKRGSWFNKCKTHYAACMATALGGPFGGNHYKSSRCNTCFQRCDFDKSWPTGVGNGTCEYWTPGW